MFRKIGEVRAEAISSYFKLLEFEGLNYQLKPALSINQDETSWVVSNFALEK